MPTLTRCCATALVVVLTSLSCGAGAAESRPTDVATPHAETTASATTTSPTPQEDAQQSRSPAATASSARCSVVAKTWHGTKRFWTSDTNCYRSPWYSGRHRVMIKYGCNSSPWYPKVAACRYRGGVHHGVDVDMPVGTPIRTAVAGRVYVRPSTLGSAYGRQRMLIRSGGKDYVLGHMSKLTVRNGQRVKAGQLVGYSGMSGVERQDGPHLHFEVRPAGGGYRAAVNPWRYARLTEA